MLAKFTKNISLATLVHCNIFIDKTFSFVKGDNKSALLVMPPPTLQKE